MHGGCSLVDHGRNNHWFNEDRRKSMTGGQEREEVSVVHTNLPNPYQPKQLAPASWLFYLGNISPVPTLIGE